MRRLGDEAPIAELANRRHGALDRVLDRTATMESLTRRFALGGLVSASFLAVAAGDARADPFVSEGLRRGRVTVPVLIDGQGPFNFAVDSAANCSVLADDLLGPLNLAPALRLTMHTLVGAEEVDGVIAGRVSSGAVNEERVRLAVGRRSALEGLDGLLGSDLLAGRRLVLNFRGRTGARIGRSHRNERGFLDPVDPSARLQSTPQERFRGLLVVPALVGPARATGIVDSGAAVTILNRAAARQGLARPWRLRNGENYSRVQSPTGRGVNAEVMLLPTLNLADAVVSNVPVLVGDFHTFALWGVADRPAVLLGVDVLGLFQSVTIDLRRREFSLRV